MRLRFKRALLVGLWIILLVSSFNQRFSISAAQVIPVLIPDQAASGQLTADTFRQLYTFDAAQGAAVDLTLTVTSGTLDPQLVLADPQGAVLQRSLRNALTNTQPTAALHSVTLPVSGTYFVIVTRFGQDRGTTTGGYTVRLTLKSGSTAIGTPASADTLIATELPTPTSAPIAVLTPITYGDQTIGAIDANPSRTYEFLAQRGDRLTITMQRIAGNLDPYLTLIDPTGKILINQDDDLRDPATHDAAIRNDLITTGGLYQIVATRFGQAAGTSHGTFALTLSKLSADQLGLSAETAALLDPGASETGSIDAIIPIRYYQLGGVAGALISVDAIRTRGNLNPTLTLTDLAGKPISEAVFGGQIGQRATLVPFAATADYLITISHAPNLVTAGNYTLTLTTWQGTTLNANGDLTIAAGTPVMSSLSNAESSHEYVFSGKAGSVVTISMTATSGDLLPSLVLETDTRRLLASADSGQTAGQPGQTGQAVQLKPFTLPGAGVYRIIATRHGRAGGLSTGAYTLTVTTNP